MAKGWEDPAYSGEYGPVPKLPKKGTTIKGKPDANRKVAPKNKKCPACKGRGKPGGCPECGQKMPPKMRA